MASQRTQQNRQCFEVQVNRRAPDFRCGIVGPGHSVHTDPATGTRWGHPMVPRGMRRKYTKKGNHS